MLPTIVLTGPSGSGKSTLTETIACCLRAVGWAVTIVHGDSFFLGPKPESYWTQENKDHPGAIDMPRLREAVRTARCATPDNPAQALVLIEGFMLLQDEAIMAMVDGVLFLHSRMETCIARRLGRTVRTGHEQAGLIRYYNHCVWPGYNTYTLPALERLRCAAAGACALAEVDADGSVDVVAERALAALRRLPGPTDQITPLLETHTAALCALLQGQQWSALSRRLPQVSRSTSRGRPHPHSHSRPHRHQVLEAMRAKKPPLDVAPPTLDKPAGTVCTELTHVDTARVWRLRLHLRTELSAITSICSPSPLPSPGLPTRRHCHRASGGGGHPPTCCSHRATRW